MLPVNLHELGSVSDDELTRVVCVSMYNGKWVYSLNKKRNGWEIPGGHIEEWENLTYPDTYHLFFDVVKKKVKKLNNLI